MKNIIKLFVLYITFVLYKIYPQSLNIKLTQIKNMVYSFWIANAFGRHKNMYIARPFYLSGGKHINVGENFSVGPGLRLEAIYKYINQTFNPVITIGNNVHFNYDCHVGSINKIEIGNNVMIGSRVLITDHSHGDIESSDIPVANRLLISKGPVIVMDNVWIGEGVVILPNVTIGKNSIIGANSVVTKSFPDNCVIAGNPAKILSYLS